MQILWDACVALKEESTLLQAARFGLNLKLFLVPQLAISSSAGLQRDGLETLFAPHLMKNHVQNPPTLEGFATCGFRKKLSDDLSGFWPRQHRRSASFTLGAVRASLCKM